MPTGLRTDVALAPYTTWHIGGPARWLAEPATEAALAALLAWAEAEGVRVYVLGGGSNLLVADAGVEGLVIRLDTAGVFGAVRAEAETGMIEAGGGAPLGRLLREAAMAGLSGLEFLAGVPGTVGGALRMNAGDPAQGIGHRVAELAVVDLRGRARTVQPAQAQFAYRWSNLGGWIVTRVRLRLEPSTPEAVTRRMEIAREQKRARQPLTEWTAGCVFRNPTEAAAGRLIEAAGFKGTRIGDAVVSERHANFIVNAGAAGSDDVRRLIDEIREGVLRAFGIHLRLEVALWL